MNPPRLRIGVRGRRLCAASRGMGYPTQSGEIRRRFLGQPTYFEAKAEEENSMSVKRRMLESVYDSVNSTLYTPIDHEPPMFDLATYGEINGEPGRYELA